VFLDKTSLSLTPSLWPSIEKALGESEFFVLMASSEAAASPWVQNEVDWWLANRSADKLLVILTDGDLLWDRTTGDFDWNKTTALPQAARRIA
jgi:TIR domain